MSFIYLTSVLGRDYLGGMPIHVQCSCGYTDTVSDRRAGQLLLCPKCRKSVQVGRAPPQLDPHKLDEPALSRETLTELRRLRELLLGIRWRTTVLVCIAVFWFAITVIAALSTLSFHLQ